MKRIPDYLLSGVYLIYFGLCLLFFHVYQVVAYHVFGPKVHKVAVDHLNFFLNFGLYLTGASIKLKISEPLPTDRPVIVLANHQSTFDIPGISWLLRRNRPVFVSKVELSKGIPSISYNLRKSGAALIDRKDGRQAIVEISRLGALIEKNNWCAVIFPEGTRTASGEMKPFAVGGVTALLKKAPSSLIVPVAINGTGRLNPTRGIFPLTSFTALSWTALKPIEPAGMKSDEITALAQQAIREELERQSGR